MDSLNSIVTKTNNDILLLFIVIAIVIILLAIPIFRLYSKSVAERRVQDIKREENILKVIKDNTSVNTAIKTLLENSTRGCESCKQEQMKHFVNIELSLNTLTERVGAIV